MKMPRSLIPYLSIFVVAALEAATASLSGELKQWHKLTLDFEGPHVSESDDYNPFLNYRLNVAFKHEKSGETFRVPGYFAADGNAANSSATSGNTWRVHFVPNRKGDWTYSVQFRKGRYSAVSHDPDTGVSGAFMDGESGAFTVLASDKSGRDFRAHGRLQYVGERYPRFSGTKEIFLKSGPDAPENLLSYADFDGTFHDDGHKDDLVKTWSAHKRDWSKGDPVWQDGKGKSLIGALNYIASKGLNSVSFLTLNIKGDDRNVFPYVDYEDYERFDVSKLDQWAIVFEHAQSLGLMLHFKTQEMENQGLLDGGGVGLQRQLYYRELIARFGHHLAINWNLGEENGEWIKNHPTPAQNTAQRRAMIQWFADHDPYQNPVVIHNGYPFSDLLDSDVQLDGISLQIHPPACHDWILQWKERSEATGRSWMLANDEQGPADFALPPDSMDPHHDESRMDALWGALMAGAWGNEWYFGYKNPHSDLTCEDWRTRDSFWEQCNNALTFFTQYEIPLSEMQPANHRLKREDAHCLAQTGKAYVVYVKDTSTRTTLDFGKPHALFTGLDRYDFQGKYSIHWYDAKNGGPLQKGTVETVTIQAGEETRSIGRPSPQSAGDWAALIRRIE